MPSLGNGSVEKITSTGTSKCAAIRSARCRLGLGMRSALLPNAMAAAEIGHSWRHLATFGVLSAWAVAGLVLAPFVLRRMARREPGSNVAARREKVVRGI